MENNLKMNKKIVLTLLISALIIVISDNLKIDYYIKSIFIPFVTLLISYIILLKDDYPLNKKHYYLLIPIILILISGVLTEIAFSNLSLNFLILPILLSIFFFFLTNKNYKISGSSIKWFWKLFPNKMIDNLKYLKFERNNSSKTISIVLGSIIGGFIGFIILVLLTSADDYFSFFIGNVTELFDFDFYSILLFIVSFVFLFSIFINILLNKNEKMEEPKIKKLDEIMIITILVIINIIFVLFIISEISKLTINFLQIPVEYTYASYAREGFFQLLIVTTINFSILMYLLYKSNIIKDSKIVKKLSLLLIAFSIILIFNSYYRMFLYIGRFGFTILRLQVMLFLTMELILFSCLIKKIVHTLKHDDAIIYFIIMISFYIMNLYLCTYSFIEWLNNIS